MGHRTEGHLGAILAQERRDRDQNRHLSAYVSTKATLHVRLVICDVCFRLVEKRLNYTDEVEVLQDEECLICGEEGVKR